MRVALDSTSPPSCGFSFIFRNIVARSSKRAERALAYGTLPPVYLSDEPEEELRGYAGLYLQEEIQAEALSRSIEGFARFLARAALSSGEVLNFESVAGDAQVPARTVREYYTVLEDTLVGSMLDPLGGRGRKAVSKGKFYFFDVGVLRALQDPSSLSAPLPLASRGPAFEHLIFQELFAYLQYFHRQRPLRFWRTHSGLEVDFVVDPSVAIEVKHTPSVQDKHTRGLRALAQEHALERQIVVCREPRARRVGAIEIYPVTQFLQELWSHQILR